MKTLSKVTVSQQEGEAAENVLPTVLLARQECQSVQDSMMSILEKSWVWLAGILDVVEGQLRMGKNFDTKVRQVLNPILQRGASKRPSTSLL